MGAFSRLVFGAAAAVYVFADEVVVGTKDNWEKLLADNPGGVLAEFYAPWCGHCKKLEPEYTKAAQALKDADVKVPLVKIDATVETKLASDFGVQGYPTMKWFVGGSPTDYDGPRNADGIVTWIKSMTGPAVVEGEPKDTDKLSITYYGESLDENFDAVAQANRKKADWYHVKQASVKIVIKHKGEPATESTDVSSKDVIEKFYKDNAFPLFGDLNGDTFSSVVEENRSMATEVAKSLAGEFSITHTNTVEFGKVLESMFGVTEFPRVIVQKKASDKKNFIYDGEMTAEAILSYVSKVKSGEVEPHMKSEPIPEKNDEPVTVVVGKNLQEVVFHAEKDVLLEVYAPWCGHCKKLDPEYIKVAKKVQKEGLADILTIAKMDGTQNDSPVESISWSGFPTIYYVKAGSDKPESYDGGRDAKGIWKWIKKNHSKADQIKAKIDAKKGEKKEEL